MALKYIKATEAKEYQAPGAIQSYSAPEYSSQYQGRLDTALNNVTDFKYDPIKDASYRALAKVYDQQGRQAANDTMGQVAAMNGGYESSYASTAAAQQRTNYNHQLAAMVPDLENNAYNRNVTALSALRDAEDSSYDRFRDEIADRQWRYSQDYQNWRDATADAQWKYSTDNSNYQWAKGYNLDVYAAKKGRSSGGGGGRSSSGGSGYYGSGGSSGSESGSAGTGGLKFVGTAGRNSKKTSASKTTSKKTSTKKTNKTNGTKYWQTR